MTYLYIIYLFQIFFSLVTRKMNLCSGIHTSVSLRLSPVYPSLPLPPFFPSFSLLHYISQLCVTKYQSNLKRLLRMKGALEFSVQGCLASWSWLCGIMGHYSRSMRQKIVCLLYSNQKGGERRGEEGSGERTSGN